MIRMRALLPLLAVLVTFSMALSPQMTFAQPEEDGKPAVEKKEEAPTEEVEEETPEEPAAVGGMGTGPDDMDFEWEVGYSINTLIMFVCAVLVLFMQAGFAMVESGLNDSKNVVNILFKNVMDLSIGALLFLFVGYGIMYPGGDYAGKWFGFGGSFVTRDAQVDDDGKWTVAPTDSDGDPYASNAVDFMFQVAFAATAATIVSGAVAGRMKFIAYLIYSGFLTALVYPVSGMWKWGGGYWAEAGFADFAGSVVVHAVGGFAGLAGAIVLGARLGRFSSEGKSQPMPGHNIALAALGVFILWVGWYGFNPGSQLTYFGAANAEVTTYIALTTTISAAAGAIAAMVFAWILFGKPDLTMALNGALGGLVGITANCDQVSQVSALIIGAVAGVLVVASVIALDKLRIDDPVGAFPVHGVCGVWGGIATGIFGTALPEITVDGVAVAMTRAQYISVQVQATVMICAWAFVTMFILFYILKLAGLLRVSQEEEERGLDIGEHGMHAYVH